MDPITIAMLGMAALNAVQNVSKEGRELKLASATQRYSPWTGLKAQPVDYANPVGDMAQAGAGALSYGQAQNMSKLQGDLVKAQIAAMNRGQSPNPYSGMRGNMGVGAYDGSPNQWAG